MLRFPNDRPHTALRNQANRLLCVPKTAVIANMYCVGGGAISDVRTPSRRTSGSPANLGFKANKCKKTSLVLNMKPMSTWLIAASPSTPGKAGRLLDLENPGALKSKTVLSGFAKKWAPSAMGFSIPGHEDSCQPACSPGTVALVVSLQDWVQPKYEQMGQRDQSGRMQ